MKKLSAFILVSITLSIFSCGEGDNDTAANATDTTASKKEIIAMLDSFNVAAANAEYDRYFDFYTPTSTFNGTDATENWDKKTFMSWAKPAFDKKRTWNFKALQRRIYFGKYPDMAWFEELLLTQMKICRGSGVVVKIDGQWKVEQYVLSTTVPNSVLDSVIKLKTPEEDSLIKTMVTF